MLISEGECRPRTGHECPERIQVYTSTLLSASAVDGVGGERHAPAALPPGKPGTHCIRRLSGPLSRSGWVRKISPPTGVVVVFQELTL